VSESIGTGSQTLDDVLRGGLPRRRATLVTGTPGTGKSTLAMQFLQRGLDTGDRCLYISTEQTPDEIRDAFAPYEFDLDHAELSLMSLHSQTGSGTEDLNEMGSVRRSTGRGGGSTPRFVMRSLEGESFLDDKQIGFTPANLYRYLRKAIARVDRVVVDSASGLRPLTENDTVYRRIVLDLVQLFCDEYEATAVFTAESTGTGVSGEGTEQLQTQETVQFNFHGVIRLWREHIRGDYRRFLDVMKMRGVNHDTRRFELTFTPQGLYVVPQGHSRRSAMFDPEFLETRIDGVDEMLGGGLAMGRSTLLQHDGQADVQAFLYALSSKTLDQRLSQVVVPRVNTSPDRLEALFSELGASMESLLENDQLFVVDTFDVWPEQTNVVHPESADAFESEIETIRERSSGKGTVYIVNTEALTHAFSPQESREIRHWLQAQCLGGADVLLDIHNPAVMGSDMSAFYLGAAEQVIDTWLTEYGLQYLQLRKGRQGDVGSLRLIEHVDEEPFVRAI
jgi:KaiC/GvpD/RAD55 family RecA-like ATPase